MTRLLAQLRRLRGDRAGATALEFALVAPMFFALLFSYYDVGLLMLRQVMLTHAVDKTMRDVRVSTSYVDLDTFIGNVCDRAMILPACRNTLVVDLVPVGKRAVALPSGNAPCRDPAVSDMRPHMRYQPNSPGRILFVRVCAVAKPILPGYSAARAMPVNSEGEVQIVTTTAFMGEE